MRSVLEIEHIDFASSWKGESIGNLNGEIHVWRFHIPPHIKWMVSKKHLLSKDEMEKLDRIFKKEDKMLFLAGKVGAKILCANYLNSTPEEIMFSRNENQKPYIKEKTNFHFNTAHSGDWVVFIFSEAPCGIDIELIDHGFEFSEVMEISFHEAEVRAVSHSPDPRSEFFRIWTQKEALLKAKGTGIHDKLAELNTLTEVNSPSNHGEQLATPWQTETINWIKDYYTSISYNKKIKNVKTFEFTIKQNN